MRKYPQLSILKPRYAVLGGLATMLVCALLIVYKPQIEINPSFKSMIMPEDPDLAVDAKAKATFGDDEMIMVAVENPKGVFNLETLQLIDRITRQIKALEGVRDIYSLSDIDNIRGRDGMLVTDDLIEQVPLTEAELKKQLAERGAPAAGVTQALADLKTETAAFVASLPTIEKEAEENPTYVNTIYSPDKKVAAITVELSVAHADSDSRGQLTQKIVDIVDREDAAAPFANVYYSGFPVSSYYSATFMIEDMLIFSVLATVLLVIIMFVIYRNVQGIIFTLFAANIAVMVPYGLMSAFTQPVTMPLSSVMVFVMALGMEYSIYVGFAYINQVRYERSQGREIRDHRMILSDAVRTVKGPVMLSTATTVVGFLSMMTNPVPDLAKMGLFLAIGCASAGFAALTVVPAIIAAWPFEVKEAKKGRGRATQWLLDRIGHTATHKPWFLIAVMTGVTLCVGVGWMRLSSETDAMQYFRKSSKVYQDEAFVRSRMAGTTYLQAVVAVDGIDAFKEPAALRKLAAAEEYAETLPHVTKAISHADHVRLINRALHFDKPEAYRIPDTKAAVSQLLLLHHEPDDFHLWINPDYNWAAIGLRMDTMSSTTLGEVEHKLEAYLHKEFPGAKVNVVGTTLLVHRAFDMMADSMLISIAAAMIGVFLIMAIAFRSLRLGFIALIPNAIPILLNYGLLGLIGRPLDPPAAVTGAIALGIAVDDTIHFFKRWIDRTRYSDLDSRQAVRETLAEIGRPMILSSVVLGVGFSVMLFSRYGTLVWISLMLTVTALNALLCDLMLTPALLAVSKPKRRRGTSKKERALLCPFEQVRVVPGRETFADYTDSEIDRMFTSDFLVLCGKTVLRHGGRVGSRRLFYELDLKPGMRVLEVGAGVGASAFNLAQDYGVHVTGVDLNQVMIDLSTRKAENLGLSDKCNFVFVEDGEHYPFEDNSFDAVIMESIVIFASAPAMFKEGFRLLKPGGRLGIHDFAWARTPDPDIEKMTCVIACGVNMGESKLYTKQGWCDRLAEQGFAVSFAETAPFSFFSMSGMRDDEGTLGLIKMFGHALKRKAVAKKMWKVMGYLARHDGAYTYIVGVGKKPAEAAPKPKANKALNIL
ncbi:MAG TPA: MMPL family transporter [Kofleriaceae bacterium]|nr:MMPL family transporter [Kofleriaceae bacterium]